MTKPDDDPFKALAKPGSPPANDRRPPSPDGASQARPRLTPGPWSWLLRTAALSTFLAAVVGVVVAPGLRGLARDRVVAGTNALAWTLAYFVTGVLVAAVVGAVLELSRSQRARSAWNGVAVGTGGLVVVLAVPAILRPLPVPIAAGLALTTSVVTLVAGLRGLSAKHTRAVAALMIALASAGFLRVVAWELARRAGDSGNTGLYAAARSVATAALGFEAGGQMIAAAWLGTRSRIGGQLLSSVAVGLAWVLTYAAAVGASVSASPWQAAAHIALATATSLPQPYGPTGLAVFLLASSILLAGVAAAQRGQAAAITAALALSLVARGAFDVPIHALAAAAAALWLILASSNDRAMWESLLASRERPGGPVAIRRA